MKNFSLNFENFIFIELAYIPSEGSMILPYRIKYSIDLLHNYTHQNLQPIDEIMYVYLHFNLLITIKMYFIIRNFINGPILQEIY